MSMEKVKKKRIWLKVTAIVGAIFLSGTVAYGFFVYKSLNEALNTIHEPVDRGPSEKRVEEITLDNKEPFSVLMLGVDERGNDRGRSDTMIVLTINPNQNSVKMLSIPRDTRTAIIGKGFDDKINHAYAFGGVEMSMDTVENFLDIPIDYYMKINMEGFQEMVDAVGGVEVNNDLEFAVNETHFPKGKITLNGEDALKFSRMRYEDPRGDFGRQQRQRQIIEAIIREGASLSSLANYDKIFDSIGNNIKTNLTFREMVDIQKNYRTAANSFESLSLSGTDQKISSIYYYIVPTEEQNKVQEELKKHLEI